MSEKLQRKTSKMRIGLLDPNSTLGMPIEPWNPNGSGVDMGPIGKTMKRTGMGVVMLSALTACGSPTPSPMTPTPEAQRTEVPNTGAIFEINDFTDYYKTTRDTKIRSLMTQLEATHGAFEESWSISSMKDQESQNSVQLFGFQNAHMVGFWTEVNGKPVMQNAQPIHGRYVFDNTKRVLTYELMVDGTGTSLSQTFLKLSIKSNSLTSLDALVAKANSGDSNAQSQLDALLSGNTGNFTISLSNLATGRTDIGTMSSDEMTQVPPTATPSQPSLLDRIMEMGVTPVQALEPTTVPTLAPTPTEIPLEQQSITRQMTEELATALTKAGLPTTPEQIIQQGFGIETITGLDGKNYEIATTLDGFRLMIRMSGETQWEGITLPTASAIKNIRFGSTTNEGEAFTDPIYIGILQNEFQIISPIDPTILDISEVLKDPYYGPFVEGLAQTHDFRLYNLFWHADHRIAGSSQPNLNDPIWEGAPRIGAQSTPEYQTKIREYMQQKASQILKDNPSVTELGFANEAFSADNSGWFAWEDSPFYRAFGDRWLIEAYMATYNAILDSGKTPGTDVKLFYGDYGFELPGNKSDHVYSEMERLKLEVAQQLNISPTEVPLIIDMQMHINFDGNVPAGEFSGSQLTEEKLIQNFDKFSNLGEIWIGEMTIKGGTTAQRQEALLKVVRASIKSGHVESIVFWDLLRDGGYWQGGRLLFDVNDGSFTKTLTYFELIKALLEDAK